MSKFPLTVVPVVLDEDINSKRYWFYVPTGCEILKGAVVVVLTSQGNRQGIAIDDSFVALDADDCPKSPRELKPVLWVSQPTCMQIDVPISKIIVPNKFASSRPNASKLSEKYLKFIADPKKLGFVQLDSSYNIVDGYITFLLYRMFGYSSVPCMFISLKEPEVQENTAKTAEDPQEVNKSAECPYEPYAIGEQVRIRTDLPVKGGAYVASMRPWLGQIVTVKQVRRSDDSYCYSFQEDHNHYFWMHHELIPMRES